jgi:NAD(P)H dehydrogenase (quinone)
LPLPTHPATIKEKLGIKGATMATTRPLIGVTGATGRLGGRVARRLAAAGVEQRVLVRDPSRAPELPGAVAQQASFENTDAVRKALTGVATLLMVSASENPDRRAQHLSFVDAAAAAGVEHVVYTSFAGAGPDCTFTLGRDHWATEEHIRGSGRRFTFLRDNLYADFLVGMLDEAGVIRGPAGDGRVAAVAMDDVADAAAAALLDPTAHAGATYTLTGPEALTLDEVAATLSAALNRTVRYERETVEEAYASRASYGAPRWQLDGWVSSYTSVANGEMAEVTQDVERLTGHPATSLAELLARGASAY